MDEEEEHQSLMGHPRRQLTFRPQSDRMPHKKFTQARSQEEFTPPSPPPHPQRVPLSGECKVLTPSPSSLPPSSLSCSLSLIPSFLLPSPSLIASSLPISPSCLQFSGVASTALKGALDCDTDVYVKRGGNYFHPGLVLGIGRTRRDEQARKGDVQVGQNGRMVGEVWADSGTAA
ncbi:hypothetical protein JOB18_048997 [Solea senegalensis]|uniref:Uncharacterized protein n=1 Tax=Solea senegalensis TaxID=28829 RepID=A0AAV6PTZ1_SOLSE|nr:hypothetical protein JOB18_048997 [Solea senegalensis]